MLDTPQLKYGTLDSLMSLSDELGKHDASIEGVIRKIERQYNDLAGSPAEPLTISSGGMSPRAYLQKFAWDIAKYSKRKSLPELVELILSGVASVDEELKQLSMNVTEMTQRLAALNRKKGGNLTVIPLEEVIKAEMLRGWIDDSEYMKSVCIVVPKSLKAEFMTSYHTIGSEIAGFGGPDWSSNRRGCGERDNQFGPFCDRKREVGSPVVPGSAREIYAEGEHLLYTVVILKGQYEAGYFDDDKKFQQGKFSDFLDSFKAAAREKRFIVRDYSRTESVGVDAKSELMSLELQEAEKKAGLQRWCKTHFGEAFCAWVHLKVIRAFVESVLRYGLSPMSAASTGDRAEQKPNFMLAVLKVNRGKGLLLKQAFDKLHHGNWSGGGDHSEEGDEAEYTPYCKLEFTC